MTTVLADTDGRPRRYSVYLHWTVVAIWCVRDFWSSSIVAARFHHTGIDFVTTSDRTWRTDARSIEKSRWKRRVRTANGSNCRRPYTATCARNCFRRGEELSVSARQVVWTVLCYCYCSRDRLHFNTKLHLKTRVRRPSGTNRLWQDGTRSGRPGKFQRNKKKEEKKKPVRR